jgi:hypothetical protein
MGEVAAAKKALRMSRYQKISKYMRDVMIYYPRFAGTAANPCVHARYASRFAALRYPHVPFTGKSAMALAEKGTPERLIMHVTWLVANIWRRCTHVLCTHHSVLKNCCRIGETMVSFCDVDAELRIWDSTNHSVQTR